jgi:hypothetical protein
MMTTTRKPDSCSICGYYLTTAIEFSGHRCIDPSHWQAAGLLTSGDYYPMAKMAAWARIETNQRSANWDIPNSAN